MLTLNTQALSARRLRRRWWGVKTSVMEIPATAASLSDCRTPPQCSAPYGAARLAAKTSVAAQGKSCAPGGACHARLVPGPHGWLVRQCLRGETKVEEATDGVEIGNGEAHSKEKAAARRQFALEDAKRSTQGLQRRAECCWTTLFDRQFGAVAQNDEGIGFDIVDGPEPPHGHLAILGQIRWPHGHAVLLGQIEIDRQRFRKNETIVVDERYLAVGIEANEFRLAAGPG